MWGDQKEDWSLCRWSDPSSPSHQTGSLGWLSDLSVREHRSGDRKWQAKWQYVKKRNAVWFSHSKLKKGYLVWVKGSCCWNTLHRSLAFWQQPQGHSGFAATSQGQHRWTPTDIPQCMNNNKKMCHWESIIVGNKLKKFKYCQGDHTCTPEDVVAVTDLKSQMTKATR